MENLVYAHFQGVTSHQLHKNQSIGSPTSKRSKKNALKSNKIKWEAKSDGRDNYCLQYFSKLFHISSDLEFSQIQQISV